MTWGATEPAIEPTNFTSGAPPESFGESYGVAVALLCLMAFMVLAAYLIEKKVSFKISPLLRNITATWQQRAAVISLGLATVFLMIQWIIYFGSDCYNSYSGRISWHRCNFWGDFWDGRDRAISRPLVYLGTIWWTLSCSVMVWWQSISKVFLHIGHWVKKDSV